MNTIGEPGSPSVLRGICGGAYPFSQSRRTSAGTHRANNGPGGLRQKLRINFREDRHRCRQILSGQGRNIPAQHPLAKCLVRQSVKPLPHAVRVRFHGSGQVLVDGTESFEIGRAARALCQSLCSPHFSGPGVIKSLQCNIRPPFSEVIVPDFIEFRRIFRSLFLKGRQKPLHSFRAIRTTKRSRQTAWGRLLCILRHAGSPETSREDEAALEEGAAREDATAAPAPRSLSDCEFVWPPVTKCPNSQPPAAALTVTASHRHVELFMGWKLNDAAGLRQRISGNTASSASGSPPADDEAGEIICPFCAARCLHYGACRGAAVKICTPPFPPISSTPFPGSGHWYFRQSVASVSGAWRETRAQPSTGRVPAPVW